MKTSQQKRGISMTLAVIAAVISVSLGVFFSNVWQANKKKTFINEFSGTVLSMPRAIESFAFSSTEGGPFSNQQLKGHWTLMFFGFTHCPMMCPTSMSALGQMYKKLEKVNAPVLPQVVMVSIDPKRDSLTGLKDYVKQFDKHFVGARAKEELVLKLTKQLGVVSMKEAPKEDGDYNIQHSGAVMIFNPAGNLVGFYSLPHKPEKMATDFIQLVTYNS